MKQRISRANAHICLLLALALFLLLFSSCTGGNAAETDGGQATEPATDRESAGTEKETETNTGTQGADESERETEPLLPETEEETETEIDMSPFVFEVNDDGKTVTLVSIRPQSTTVEIPGSGFGYTVTAIGGGVFAGIPVTEVILPPSVTEIGNGAFRNCRELQTIVLPEGLLRIGDDAFYGCASLQLSALPDSLLFVGHNAFRECDQLLSEDNGLYYFDDWLLFRIEDFATAMANDVRYTVRPGTKMLADGIFENAGNLTKIDLPDSIVSIGKNCFFGCRSLDVSQMPEGLSRIGDGAFSGCLSLSALCFSDTLTEIGNGAFSGCLSLSEVTFGSGLISLGNDAFANCNLLSSVKLPEGLRVLGDRAFSGCVSLSRITLPSGIANIGIRVFHDTAAYADNAFWYRSGFYVGNVLMEVNPAQQGYFVFREGTEDVAAGAFMQCENLLAVVLPDTMTVLRRQTFSGCTGMKNLKFPAALTVIEDYAFWNCTSLTVVELPDGVCRIGNGAFLSCRNLKNVRVPGEGWMLDENGCFHIGGDGTPVVFKTLTDAAQILTKKWY